MPGTVLMPALVAALLASAGVIWAGASERDATITASSAAAFLVVLLLVAWQMNAPFWRSSNGDDVTARKLSALRRNARLSVLVYAWGALSMALAYKMTSLYWQHGLQYAIGMLVFALAIFAWVHVARPGSRHAEPAAVKRAQLLNLVHGAAAAVALATFLISGKLWVDRPDWVANQMFVFGGIGIVALCTLAALTLRKIEAQG